MVFINMRMHRLETFEIADWIRPVNYSYDLTSVSTGYRFVNYMESNIGLPPHVSEAHGYKATDFLSQKCY